MKFISISLIAVMLVCVQVRAQDTPTREIGLRTSDLSSVGLVYKKQISENTYRRYRLAFGNLNAVFVSSTSLIGFSVGEPWVRKNADLSATSCSLCTVPN